MNDPVVQHVLQERMSLDAGIMTASLDGRGLSELHGG